ncbi:hypothetical protein [Phocaeicola coprophilus]|uniref:hypothetical protein n=1 Tax=Phocaeicola coprophilus TaxID=387090 RepID=UPI002672FC15|nr:hypothetical protein [Phocaeicola coprophilus]
MKTKIVYALVSDGNGFYFEKAYLSAWSVKHYNPNAHITLILDNKTRQVLDAETYTNFIKLVDEEIVVPFNDNSTNTEKSRWLKTKLRELVKGDFLFLDVDTIACSDLSDIDNTIGSIGFTWDFNCLFSENPSRYYYAKLMRRYFNQDINFDGYYFNSGVCYAKDDVKAYDFFSTWHENWLHTRNQGYLRDQLSLLKTTSDLSSYVNEISGSYNCQISTNLRYLHDAKIIHFYKMGSDFNFSPFLGNDIYLELRNSKKVTDQISDKILNCKSIFYGPVKIVGGNDFCFMESRIYQILKRFYLYYKQL